MRKEYKLSRPRYYWYSNVKRMVNSYKKITNDNSYMAKRYDKAINKALEEVGALDNGEDRIKAIYMVYINQTHTPAGAASKLNYSERTIFRWLNNFIHSVGKNVGF